MATAKQIEANRRNAAKSTGPKTEEGKTRSRANALTHGLTATTLRQDVAIEAEKPEEESRLAQWITCLKPEGPVEAVQVELMVEASMLIEKCRARAQLRNAELAEIAAASDERWQLDRDIETAMLTKSLTRNPEEVALRLRMTPGGRAWLIDAWKTLLLTVPEGKKGAWTDAESNVALDLLGRPKMLRNLLLEHANPFADPQATRARILKEIAALEAGQANDAASDARLRNLHIQGLIFETDPTLVVIRRYQTTAIRQFDKSMKDLKKTMSAPAKAEQARTVRPIRGATVAPTPTCETKPIPVAATASQVAHREASNCEANPISTSIPRPITPSDLMPQVSLTAAVTNQVPTNRNYRRQLRKEARHQAYLERRSR